MARKNISKKIRFEVLKRDCFKCQYCGVLAADKQLHVDHIIPVSKGGSNELLNLVTACVDCNLGKNDRGLSDDAVVRKQQKQQEISQSKINELEMVAKWHRDSGDAIDRTVKEIEKYLNDKIGFFTEKKVTDLYLLEIKKLLKKYTIDEVFSAIDKSEEQYLKDESTAENFLEKIPKIVFWTRKEIEDPEMWQRSRWFFYAKKNWRYINRADATDVFKRLQSDGITDEEVFPAIYNSYNLLQLRNKFYTSED